MFTGIVELMGTVREYNPYDDTESGGQGVSITIENAHDILGDCHIGDSIAVNGICLTVTEFDSDSFKVGISRRPSAGPTLPRGLPAAKSTWRGLCRRKCGSVGITCRAM